MLAQHESSRERASALKSFITSLASLILKVLNVQSIIIFADSTVLLPCSLKVWLFDILTHRFPTHRFHSSVPVFCLCDDFFVASKAKMKNFPDEHHVLLRSTLEDLLGVGFQCPHSIKTLKTYIKQVFQFWCHPQRMIRSYSVCCCHCQIYCRHEKQQGQA